MHYAVRKDTEQDLVNFVKEKSKGKLKYIYGTGTVANKLYEQISSTCGECISGFIDYDFYPENKIGDIFNGKPVHSLSSLSDKDALIIIASCFGEQIQGRIDKESSVNVDILSILDYPDAGEGLYRENKFLTTWVHCEAAVIEELAKFGVGRDIYEEICQICKPYTFCSGYQLGLNMIAVVSAIKKNRKGVIVEAGVWKGGSSLAMLLIQKKVYGKVLRPVYMFDKFSHMPSPKELDGEAAKRSSYKKAFTGEGTYVNDVRSLMEFFKFCGGRDFHIIEGWLEETAPKMKKELSEEKIAVLRLDVDWYEATMLCLETFEPSVSEDSMVIVDDYSSYAGCAHAVHEYLANNQLKYRLFNLNINTYFYKSEDRKYYE